MEKRRFGRTGHMSTVAILGCAAFGQVSQAETDAAMERVIAAGVNHIDIAPSYGNAEARLAPWMKLTRSHFFLGCKTTERTREGAWAELHRSLERLGVEQFDLYQLHAVKTFEELDQVTAPGGALEAAIQARADGLTRFIGITGHGFLAPQVYLEALKRFDFDSVLFPLNFVQYANPDYRRASEELIRTCRARDVGTMVIKAICKRPWGDRHRSFATWYEPFADPVHIQQAVDFALSQDITGLCTVGDVSLLPLMLNACARYTALTPADQAALIATSAHYEPLFA
ncbi:MAG: aldo/keto reductase [Chloroflexi bacterium]|nr:aldo/keto reductase [Chloroflexota bacterium]